MNGRSRIRASVARDSRFAVVALGLAILVAAPSASAQTRAGSSEGSDESRRQEARRHFDRGVAFAEQSRWDDAIHELEAARDLRATVAVLFNLGMAYRAVGRRRDAITTFRAFLDAADPNDVARRTEVERVVTELSASLARVTLRVVPSDAQVSIDGTPIPIGAGAANGTFAIDLDPGRHVLSASAEGFRTELRTQEFTQGRSTSLELHLIPTTRVCRLLVDTNVRTAAIRIDERAAAPGNADEFLESGTHRIEASAPGRRTVHRDVTIAAGQTIRIQLDLGPDHTIFESPYFWATTGGVVVAAVVVGVVLAITPQPVSNLGSPACVGQGCP